MTPEKALERNIARGIKVDDSDRHLLLVPWFVNNWGHAERGVWKDGRRIGTERLHLVISPVPTGKSILHINGDKLDNRRANLLIISKPVPDNTTPPDVALKENLALGIKVDPEDEHLLRFKWYLGDHGYPTRNAGTKNGKPTIVLLHREIMKPPKGMVTDHINGDVLDNRRSNLRVVDHKTNCQNISHERKSGNGAKGVRWNEKSDTWTVILRSSGKQHRFGTYKSKAQAEAVALEQRKRLHPGYTGR